MCNFEQKFLFSSPNTVTYLSIYLTNQSLCPNMSLSLVKAGLKTLLHTTTATTASTKKNQNKRKRNARTTTTPTTTNNKRRGKGGKHIVNAKASRIEGKKRTLAIIREIEREKEEITKKRRQNRRTVKALASRKGDVASTTLTKLLQRRRR